MLRVATIALFACSSVLGAYAGSSDQNGSRKREFLILNDDGYGTSDCLVRPSACGKIVADAWCESKGFAKAASYRPANAEDVTGSTGPRRSALSETFVIACSE